MQSTRILVDITRLGNLDIMQDSPVKCVELLLNVRKKGEPFWMFE